MAAFGFVDEGCWLLLLSWLEGGAGSGNDTVEDL